MTQTVTPRVVSNEFQSGSTAVSCARSLGGELLPTTDIIPLILDNFGYVRVLAKDWGSIRRITAASGGTLVFTGLCTITQVNLVNKPAGIDAQLTIYNGTSAAGTLMEIIDGATGMFPMDFAQRHSGGGSGFFYVMTGTVIGEWVVSFQRDLFDA